MEKLTNIIEAVLFASGESVPVKEIAEKLDVNVSDVRVSVEEIKLKYPPESGIQLLSFNGKLQLSTNPLYKDEVSCVLNPIKEKEFTRTILECAAIVAYKQPITRTELEVIRGVNSDYAIRTLLELDMIFPCGRRDSIGKPIMYATTDNFLKRFRLNSLDDLPDYEQLMEKIARDSAERPDNYLYRKDEYVDEGDRAEESVQTEGKETENGFEIPDFLKNLGEDDLIKIE